MRLNTVYPKIKTRFSEKMLYTLFWDGAADVYYKESYNLKNQDYNKFIVRKRYVVY